MKDAGSTDIKTIIVRWNPIEWWVRVTALTIAWLVTRVENHFHICREAPTVHWDTGILK